VAALRALIALVAPRPDDLIVTLGDYVDCGPDSKGVLDYLLELEQSLRLVAIRGNHEVMMSDARHSTSELAFWKQCGGDWALRSYGGKTVDCIPTEHFEFLRRCVDDYEIDTHFFIHANYWPNRRLSMQDSRTRYWSSLKESVPEPHFSGKIAVVGHTPHMDGRIFNAGHLICVDTGCGYGGRLTAFDVRSGEYWQVSEAGEPL